MFSSKSRNILRTLPKCNYLTRSFHTSQTLLANPPPDVNDPKYDHIMPSKRPDIQPTNSSPPSHWDRIPEHENPPVSRPTQVYQALAPREGLPPVRVRRVAYNKYWKPTTMMVVMWLVTMYWMYETDQFRNILRTYEQEEELHRAALIAFLQAEKDIAYAIEKRAFDKKVAELMRDEPDFILNQRFYHKATEYREPFVFPTLISFEETGLLQRDIDRLQQMIDEYKVEKAREQIAEVSERLKALKATHAQA